MENQKLREKAKYILGLFWKDIEKYLNKHLAIPHIRENCKILFRLTYVEN